MTEQYPKALGPTVSELKDVLPAEQRYVDKTRFSMCGALPSESHQCMPQRSGARHVAMTALLTHAVDAVKHELEATPSVKQVRVDACHARACMLRGALFCRRAHVC